MSNANDRSTQPTRPYRPLAVRPAPREEVRLTLMTDAVTREIKRAIDDLRAERAANDERAERAKLRDHPVDQRYYFAKSDGLSSGIAALRDLLFHLTSEDY